MLGFRFRLGLRLGIGIGLGLGIGIADLNQIAINFGAKSDRRAELNTVLILIHRTLTKGHSVGLFLSLVEHIDLRYTAVTHSNSRIVVSTVYLRHCVWQVSEHQCRPIG